MCSNIDGAHFCSNTKLSTVWAHWCQCWWHFAFPWTWQLLRPPRGLYLTAPRMLRACRQFGAVVLLWCLWILSPVGLESSPSIFDQWPEASGCLCGFQVFSFSPYLPCMWWFRFISFHCISSWLGISLWSIFTCITPWNSGTGGLLQWRQVGLRLCLHEVVGVLMPGTWTALILILQHFTKENTL